MEEITVRQCKRHTRTERWNYINTNSVNNTDRAFKIVLSYLYLVYECIYVHVYVHTCVGMLKAYTAYSDLYINISIITVLLCYFCCLHVVVHVPVLYAVTLKLSVL